MSRGSFEPLGEQVTPALCIFGVCLLIHACICGVCRGEATYMGGGAMVPNPKNFEKIPYYL